MANCLTTSNELLQCPITLDIFHDPVLAQDGHTYERKAIEDWIRDHGTSPLTREPLLIEQLFPNLIAKELVGCFETFLREKNYQFLLDDDVRRKKGRPIFQTFGKSIYAAEWLPAKNNRPEIVLLKIDGVRRKNEASFYVNLSRHPHVIRTFGFVYDKNIPDQNKTCLLLQEDAPEGSLSELLQERSIPPTEEILIRIFFQIIEGMIHLASNHVVHGDLACRNILVFRYDEKESEKIVVKITDFGLSQSSQLYSVLPGAGKTILNIIPVRYAAPEVLSSNETSEKSDVYSMGVLMWEAYSRGALPWTRIDDDDDVIQKVTNGETLSQPSNCTQRFWSIIKKTWSRSPNDRPTFSELKRLISEEYYSHDSKLQCKREQFKLKIKTNFPENRLQEEDKVEESTLLQQHRMAKQFSSTEEEDSIIDSSTHDTDESENTSVLITDTLYVGDLHPDVTESMLFEKFSNIGPISHIHVCRNSITQQSLGYAYVHFQRVADAKYALETMNFTQLHGRPLRIMWPQRDPILRKSGVGNVIIKNLDTNIDSKSLYDTFSSFGDILSCKIATDEHGQSKGFGFVQFQNQKSANNAIAKANGMLLRDKKVSVSRFLSRDQRVHANDPKKFTNIFIKNFGDQLDEDKLRELLSKYGRITSCKIETDENGKSKGFGFCRFETPEEAEVAIEELNDYSIGDKQLYVGYFQKKNERLSEIKRKKDRQHEERRNKCQCMNVYIKNLDDTIDDERLQKEFSKFGTITSAKVMTKYGRSRGFGFVCFSTADEATKAITEMHGSIIGSKSVYVALAQRKEERRTHLINEHMQRLATACAQTQTQSSFPNATNERMPSLLANIRPSQPQNYLPPGGLYAYSSTPYWIGVAPVGLKRPAGPYMLARMQIAQTNIQQQQQQSCFYTPQARNLPQNNATVYTNSIVVLGQKPLTSAELANATPQGQKQMLGERLFPLIQQIQPDLARKITDILLEIDNTELLHMLESPELLRAKIEEATTALQVHQAKQISLLIKQKTKQSMD